MRPWVSPVPASSKLLAIQASGVTGTIPPRHRSGIRTTPHGRRSPVAPSQPWSGRGAACGSADEGGPRSRGTPPGGWQPDGRQGRSSLSQGRSQEWSAARPGPFRPPVELQRLRRQTTEELARAVSALGVPMSASTITKIEKRKRRVTVDELVALAAVLGVSPVTLMLPAADSGQGVRLAPRLLAHSWSLTWMWMHGDTQLAVDGTEESEIGRFQWVAMNRPYLTEKSIKSVKFAQPNATTEIRDEDDGSDI
ncbi:helix-turn-helix domain-containing protein [Streptomyces sp. NPDC008343]|uniref:helix-turn-helix domain-containing protein n=1 Tax=Streptomyces sp. NPDC008343 TaxID=3364828 RepID=UPI0036EF2199